MKNLGEKIENIQSQVSVISNHLKTVNKVLVTKEEYDESDDVLYDVSRCSIVDKYGHYIEYVIMEIKEGGKLTVGGLGDDHGEIREMEVAELTTDEVLWLAIEL